MTIPGILMTLFLDLGVADDFSQDFIDYILEFHIYG